MPASATTTARDAVPRGVTSPRPRVKKVVPLMYKLVPKVGTPSELARCDPSPHSSTANPTIIPTAQAASSRMIESGPRSEERRVGKEGRTRRAQSEQKKERTSKRP